MKSSVGFFQIVLYSLSEALPTIRTLQVSVQVYLLLSYFYIFQQPFDQNLEVAAIA